MKPRPILGHAESVLPYSGTSTFSMMDSTGAVENFSVEDSDQFWWELEETVEGRKHQYLLERFEISFVGDLHQNRLGFTLWGDKDGGRNVFTVSLPGLSAGTYTFPTACPFEAMVCQEQDTIAGIPYSGILHWRSIATNSDSLNKSDFWYHPSVGLVRYQTSDGHYWELVP